MKGWPNRVLKWENLDRLLFYYLYQPNAEQAKRVQVSCCYDFEFVINTIL